MLKEEELIEYAKQYLKEKGFSKNNKRWTKDIGEFTLVFFIQGSCYDKEDYYIRPGIYINELNSISEYYYGHFAIEIAPTNLEEIFKKFEKFCKEWTNKQLIKERLNEFIEMDKRNSMEKSEKKLKEYEEFSHVLFSMSQRVKEFILKNY